jgi:hypothetical protein
MNIGDRVRLRDGVLPWITKRDGWKVDDNGYEGVVQIIHGTVWIQALRDEIEPESPPIPPEPDARAVLLQWGDGYPTILTRPNNKDRTWWEWESTSYDTYAEAVEDAAANRRGVLTLTPLYPVPDPDDDEAVEALLRRTTIKEGPYLTPTIRDVLRALREEQGDE